MPVHNGARFLREAIDSVLSQTFTDLELLVVDDGSTDESVAIATSVGDARVRCLTGHGRLGLPGTLNVGLNAAAGEYIARLDADDRSHRERIEKQVARLDRDRAIALVGSLARLIDERGAPAGVVRRPTSALAVRWYALLENPLIHSAAMFRRDAATRIGGYDASLPLAEDYDLWGRLLQRYDAANIDECLIDYRRWSASVMSKIEGPDGGDRQRQLNAIMASLIKRHINAEFGSGACDDAQAALLAGFTLGIAVKDCARFLSEFFELRRRFETKYPAALDDADYWRTVAGQYDAIAFRMTPPSRAASFGVYVDAAKHAPRSLVHFSWPRAIALIALGKSGRAAAARMKSAVAE